MPDTPPEFAGMAAPSQWDLDVALDGDALAAYQLLDFL
jgi:hypothetical protein